MTRDCGATLPAMNEPGWVCDGTNLVVLIERGSTFPPAVLRRDRLPYLGEPESAFLPGRPFAGGDHAHLVLRIPLIAPREVAPDAA